MLLLLQGQPPSMPEPAPEAAHDHHILQLIASVARQAGQLGNIEMPGRSLTQPPQPSSPVSSLSCSPSAHPSAEQLQADKPPLPQTRSRLAHPAGAPAQASRNQKRPAGSAPLRPASGLPAAHPARPKTGPRQKAAPGAPSNQRRRLQQASGPGSQQKAPAPSARSGKAQEEQQQQEEATSSRAREPVAVPRQHGKAQARQQRGRAQHAGPLPSASKLRPKPTAAKQGPPQKRQEAGAAQHAAAQSRVGTGRRRQGSPPRPAPAEKDHKQKLRRPGRAAAKSAAEAPAQPACVQPPSHAPGVPAAASGPAQAVRTRQQVQRHEDLHPATSSPVDEASTAGAEPPKSSSVKPAHVQSQPARSPPRSRKPLAKPVQVPASKWPGLRRLIAQIGLPQFRLYSQVNALGQIKAHRGSRQLRSRPLVSLSASR